LMAVISFASFRCIARNCLPMFLASSLAMLYHQSHLYPRYEVANITKLLHPIYLVPV
jgi:hypothetical protein